MRKITRGPKPARALRELGLSSDLPAAVPTTAGVIETLRALDLHGRRVGVQLYGDEPNAPLIDFLTGAGAQVRRGRAVSLCRRRHRRRGAGAARRACAPAQVDAIAFTSKAQVERLFRAAPRETVRAALAATNVAAVGPVVSRGTGGPRRGRQRDADERLVHEAAGRRAHRSAR